MQFRITFVTALFLSAFFTFAANAQTDSSYYNLGRISIKKNSTQAITVKGSDLEKMPFSSLTEALNVWFNGSYTNTGNLVYVVDGSVIDDINAYSIYDIEEITLIQNAATLLSGAAPYQQLILVKTRRRHSGKNGLALNGQSNLVSLHNPTGNGYNNSKTSYHEYNLSAYQDNTAVHSGLSADFQHDSFPQQLSTPYTATTTSNLNRFRFKGYADVSLPGGSTLSVDAGFVPLKASAGTTSAAQAGLYTTQTDGLQNLLQGRIKLVSPIVKGLTNTFLSGYKHYSITDEYSFNSILTSGYASQSTTRDSNFARNLLVSDQIAYVKKTGDWEFEPTINFSFRYSRLKNDNYTYSSTSGGPGVPNYSAQLYSSTSSGKFYLLTPNLRLQYLNTLTIQAGLQAILNNTASQTFNGYTPQKIYPFAIVSWNVLQATDTVSKLTINASFAQTNPIIQTDGGFGLSAGSPQPYFLNNTVVTTPNASYVSLSVNPYKAFNQYQAGITYGLVKSKLSIAYNYTRYQYYTYATNLLSSYYVAGYATSNTVLQSHNINVTGNIINCRQLSWLSGLNFTIINNTDNFSPSVGSVTTNGTLKTGGFINRFACGNVFAGFDVLYQFEGTQFIAVGQSFNTNNAPGLSLQNLYVGSKLKIGKLKDAEIFANSRNIFQNSSSTITDGRRFYGIGFKAGI